LRRPADREFDAGAGARTSRYKTWRYSQKEFDRTFCGRVAPRHSCNSLALVLACYNAPIGGRCMGTTYRRSWGSRAVILAGLGVAVAVAASPGSARAATIHLGDATGGVAVHFNSTGPTTLGNVSYVKAEFSEPNTNGAQYNYDSTPIPGAFGLDWY